MEKLQKDFEKRSWFFGVIVILCVIVLGVNWFFDNILTGMWEYAPISIVGLGFASFMASLIFAQYAKQVEQKIMNRDHP